MSRKFFGTDGVRGVANETLTPEFAFNLGQATGKWMLEHRMAPRLVVGRDTRRSGPMLEASLSSGLNSVGISVVSLGVAPTPAVAFTAHRHRFGLGAIISASHNPAPDNGIKFISSEGKKLLDSAEEEIEQLLGKPTAPRLTGGQVGSIEFDSSLLDNYLDHLRAIVPGGLAGLKVAVDAAHGAAFQLAPKILEELGAEVTLTGAFPDGMNINAEGGATKPATIQKLTETEGCDVGVAFDGDADRAVFSDEQGKLINGDATIASWCTFQQELGLLDPELAVGTVMSNGGYAAYLASIGVELLRTPVGDKYVSEQIFAKGAKVGGEQSGHIIFSQRGPTGDGLVTMLEFLSLLFRSGKNASEWRALYEPWPQLLLNLHVEEPKKWAANTLVKEAVEAATAELGAEGRVNLRASGTQPVLRLMVEARDEAMRNEVAEVLEALIHQELKGKTDSRVELTHALGD